MTLRGERPKKLSPRELTVLTALRTGVPQKEAAKHLEISQHTLAANTRSIYAKLGALNLAQAVSMAYEMGIFQPGASGEDY